MRFFGIAVLFFVYYKNKDKQENNLTSNINGYNLNNMEK